MQTDASGSDNTNHDSYIACGMARLPCMHMVYTLYAPCLHMIYCPQFIDSCAEYVVNTF